MSNNNYATFILANGLDPHRQRRKKILLKYPEIKMLFGYEYKTKYILLVLLSVQFILAFYTQQLSWMWWLLILYFIGATINHSIFTAIHELTHHLVFKSKLANRCFAVFINFPLGIPVAMGFEKYHYSHHRFLGDIKKDVDIPLESEAKFFDSRKGKLLWLLIQPFTYTIRPLIKWPRKITNWEWVNIIAQLLFDIAIVSLLGWTFLAFLILSSLVGMSLHPMATHFIAEHYVVHEQQETYSYYGPMNYLTFNFGHHVEHHDFPGIPWSRLPQLRKMAPEFYDSLYTHKSWIGLMVKFIFSKKINLFSRMTRHDVA